MKSTIKYNTSNQEAADRAALNDTLQWYGKPYIFKMLARSIRGGCSYNQLVFSMSFSGVEGYPVDAMWRRYSSNTDSVV